MADKESGNEPLLSTNSSLKNSSGNTNQYSSLLNSGGMERSDIRVAQADDFSSSKWKIAESKGNIGATNI